MSFKNLFLKNKLKSVNLSEDQLGIVQARMLMVVLEFGNRIQFEINQLWVNEFLSSF